MSRRTSQKNVETEPLGSDSSFLFFFYFRLVPHLVEIKFLVRRLVVPPPLLLLLRLCRNNTDQKIRQQLVLQCPCTQRSC